jgi:hypothetical protein
MGVYVFSKRALHQWLTDTRADFGHDVIPAMIEGGARVYGYRFDGYWQDVGTIQSYWEANLALLSDAPELDLYDREWVIHTRSEERAPAKIGATAQVHRSLISHGCVINGSVVNSVLSPGVVVDVGAVVRDSIVLFDSVDPARARSSIAPSSTRKSRSARAPSSARGPTTTSSTAASPAASTPASQWSASGRSFRGASGSDATFSSARGSGRPTSCRGSYAAVPPWSGLASDRYGPALAPVPATRRLNWKPLPSTSNSDGRGPIPAAGPTPVGDAPPGGRATEGMSILGYPRRRPARPSIRAAAPA